MRKVSPFFLGLFLSGTMLIGAVIIASAAPALAESLAQAETTVPPTEKIGFPQLNVETYPTQIFWLLVSFILLFTLMSKVALPRVARIVEARAASREENLSEARRMQEEAEKIKIAFEADLAKAQLEAEQEINTVTDKINEKATAETARFGEHARKRIASAEQAIERAKVDAAQSLTDVSSEIAAEVVNKIIGGQLTKTEAKRAVADAMKEEG
jgi:F-type H+-transporting ATPase subunit b